MAKVLIADDDKVFAKAVQLKLEHLNIEVVVLHSGPEALDFLTKEQVDLVILDLMMPDVDGFKVLEKLKEQGVTVPVIVSSGLGQEEDIKRVKELGAKDYFVKSSTPVAELVKNVQKMLGE